MQVPHKTFCAALTLLALAPALTGCMVSSKDGTNGDHNVAIQTPLGSMNVKTDPSAVQAKLGLPLYPGAVLKQKAKSDDKDNDGSADVDMNFGPFHLRVLAMSFTSTDSPDKISAFYGKALSQYSDVITCRHKQPVGKPEKTGLGLTCEENDHSGKLHAGNFHTGSAVAGMDEQTETQLKAGSPSRQHIVAFTPKNGGTEFAMISLELPQGDDEKDKDKDKTPN